MAITPENSGGAVSDASASVPPPGRGAASEAATAAPRADREPSPSPGWDASPEAPGQSYWDGTAQTEHYSDQGSALGRDGQPVLRSKLLMCNTRVGLETMLNSHLKPYRKEQVVGISYAQTQHFVLLSRFSVVVVTEEPPAS